MPVIPELWEAKVGRSQGQSEVQDRPGQHGETLSTKNTKISRAQWLVPVIPATQEAEAGELLEPRRWRLQWAEIVPLHFSLGDKVRLPIKKEKQKKAMNKIVNAIDRYMYIDINE